MLHDWCNKGCGMCCPVCGMVHIKESMLLIKKSSLCGSSGFPVSLSEWSFTICPTPFNVNKNLNVLSVSLNKTFPSILPSFQPNIHTFLTNQLVHHTFSNSFIHQSIHSFIHPLIIYKPIKSKFHEKILSSLEDI